MLRRRVDWAVLALSACALFALRAAFLSPSLDDIDSANFYLGVERFSPPDHAPHPPGFPVFIFVAKALNLVLGSPLDALTLLSAITGALAVIPLYLLGRRLFDSRIALAACVFTFFTPIVWFAGARPMSDTAGLFAILAAQALLAAGLEPAGRKSDLHWNLGAIAAGLSIGVRLQAVWLTLPIFAFGWLVRRRSLLSGPLLLTISVAAWLIPMVYLSGGIDRYQQAFALVMREAARSEPLMAHWSVPAALETLRATFVAPWVSKWLALSMLMLATVGIAESARSHRRSLGLLLILFLPYSIYHYLVQNTVAVRYAIAVVPLVALAAGCGLEGLLRQSTGLRAVCLTAYIATAAAVTMPALIAYHAEPGPTFLALREVGRRVDQEVAVSGSHGFGRYLRFAAPGITVAPARPGSDFGGVGEYWRTGGRRPVYFLSDPALDPAPFLSSEAIGPVEGRWSFPQSVDPFMRGERPLSVKVTRLQPPAWFTIRKRFDPRMAAQQVGLQVRGYPTPRDLLLLGDLESNGAHPPTFRVDGEVRDHQIVDRRFMFQARISGDRYASIALDSNEAFAITDILAPTITERVLVPIRGLSEAQKRGEKSFRLLEARTNVLLHVPAGGASLRLSGGVPESPTTPGILTLRWEGNVVGTVALAGKTFAVAQRLEPAQAPWGVLQLEVSGNSIPPDRSSSQDPRQLSPRIDRLELDR